MVVRGAPAIGATAAYGVYMAAREFASEQDFEKKFKEACTFLSLARPTAVNLKWAIDRMLETYDKAKNLPIGQILALLKTDADAIRSEDIATNKEMGRIGNTVVPANATILTHCNTGALATAGWGTAL